VGPYFDHVVEEDPSYGAFFTSSISIDIRRLKRRFLRIRMFWSSGPCTKCSNVGGTALCGVVQLHNDV